MESGRPNIDALLNEEVNRTSGRMSVSGKYQLRQPLRTCDLWV
jgi:hypothetical protein